MEEGTTNIDKLPTDNVYDQNITMETKPIQNQQMPQQQMPQQQIPQQQMSQQQMAQQQMPQQQMLQQQMPQQMPQQIPQPQQTYTHGHAISRPASPQLNQPTNNDPSLVGHLSEIQQMNLMGNGAMDLPSRDIPTSTLGHAQDPQIQPNYVPQGINYINNQVSQDMINEYGKIQNNNENNYDYVYDELKIPVIIGVIFFIFNQQYINDTIFNYFPGLFNNEHHLKRGGILFKALLFGLSYYSIDKIIKHFSKI